MNVALNVELLACTPTAEALVYAAMRQCYSDDYATRLFNYALTALSDQVTDGVDATAIFKFIDNVLESGHESPIEHIVFTFAVSGVSRALTHQLVRHRHATYSQQSQRYVDAKRFNYIIPPNIARLPRAKELFINTMDTLAKTYEQLQTMLTEGGYGKTANEDARFVLPNACETRVVFTMNARELLHFFRLRCCTRAQWEIRNMALVMFTICKDRFPELFRYAGPSCLSKGYCPEGKRTCGKTPTLTMVMEKWNKRSPIDDIVDTKDVLSGV